jgi:hypothetical protein
MVDVTSTNNNDVITKVVRGVEIAEIISRDVLDIITVSLNGLAHHMLSVNVEVAVLKSGLHVAVVAVLVLLSNLLLNELELVGIEGAASNKVTKKLDSLGNITLEDLEVDLSVLSIGLAGEAGSHVFDGLSDVALVAVGSSAEEHLLKEVGSA